MIDLSLAPARILALPRESRGFPVPWFVHWNDDGTPDFRIIGDGKMEAAYHKTLCWICGQKLGVYLSFVVGPMCAVNEISGEPPSHHDCAIFAAKACPFMTTPKMHRRERGLPEGLKFNQHMLPRNPGSTLVWTTKSYEPWNTHPGVVFKMGPPISTLWFAEGREATREEILESINSGLPILQEYAEKEGPDSIEHLNKSYAKALTLVPE
jgi:hypothetical protein